MSFFRYAMEFIVFSIIPEVLTTLLSTDLYNPFQKYISTPMRIVICIIGLIICLAIFLASRYSKGTGDVLSSERHQASNVESLAQDGGEPDSLSVPRFTRSSEVTLSRRRRRVQNEEVSLEADPTLNSSRRHQATDVESLAQVRGEPDSLRRFISSFRLGPSRKPLENLAREEVSVEPDRTLHSSGRHQATDVPEVRGEPDSRSLPQFTRSSRVTLSRRWVQNLAPEEVSVEYVQGGPDFPGNDSDFRVVRDTVLYWSHDKWQVRREVEDPQARMTIQTNDCVTDISDDFRSDRILLGSKVLLRRLEIGPQTTTRELEKLSLEFYAAMRRAQAIDKDCTLQLGSFAVLKYTDAGRLKSWRLQEQWTPKICCVVRYCDSLVLLPGQTTKWSIRGFNLQNAVLKVSTTKECEILEILRQSQESREDVLICEVPRLLSHGPPTGEAIYIYAVKSVEVEEGVTVDVQSKPKILARRYWISVVECFRHSPWNTVIVPCIPACIMITTAVLITNITHQQGLQLTGNVDISLEKNSILALFLPGLRYFFFFLVLIDATLVFIPTLRPLIQSRPLVDNVPGREITCTPEDLSNNLNATSMLNENELGSKDVNIEGQEEKADNVSFKTTLPAVADNKSIEKTENLEVDVDDVSGQQKTSISEDLSTNINPTSPLHSENELGSKDVNIEEEEEKEGSVVLGGESMSTLSGSTDNVSFKTTLPAVADNKSIEKTENLEVDVDDVVPGQQKTSISEDLSTNTNPTSPLHSENELGLTDVNTEEQEEEEGSGVLANELTSALSGSKDSVSFKSTSPAVFVADTKWIAKTEIS